MKVGFPTESLETNGNTIVFCYPLPYAHINGYILIQMYYLITDLVTKPGLRKQSKILTKQQIETMLLYLGSTRHPLWKRVMFFLSVKSGLISKETSGVKWSIKVSPTGKLGDSIQLINDVSKGKSGDRIIQIHKELKKLLVELYDREQSLNSFDVQTSHVVRTERSPNTSSQSTINMFQAWYRGLGFIGCSGRRTFITDLSKKVSLISGSLRDIQVMVGHKSLQTTQRYIEGDTDYQREMVNLI